VAVAGAGALAAALGIWIYLKNKDGQPVAVVHVPDGESATIVPDGAPSGTAPAPTGPAPIGIPNGTSAVDMFRIPPSATASPTSTGSTPPGVVVVASAPAPLPVPGAKTYTPATAVAPGPAIDLLPLVQLPRDKVQGHWFLSGSTLQLRIGGGPGCRVQIPYTPAGDEYDLALTANHAFQRRPVAVLLGMVVGGRQVYGRIGRTGCGISDGDPNRAPNYVDYPELPFEQQFTIVCSVRKDSIRIRFNDQELLVFQGDFNQLTGPQIAVPRLDQLFLAVDIDTAFDFQALRIAPVGWTAVPPLASTATPGAATAGTATSGPATTATATTTTAKPSRKPVPDAAAARAALASVKDVFKDAYAAARTPSKKSELAGKLFEQSNAAANDTERYVLLDEAVKVGADGDNIDAARQALYALVFDYKVPKAQTYVDGWKSMLGGARPPETVRALLSDMNKLFDGAVKFGQFDEAKGIGDYATITAQRLRDVVEIKNVRDRNLELAGRQKEYAAAKTAAEKLAAAPDDPEANLTVGRYRALVEKDWGAALPLLTKGSDPVWKDLAMKTLAAGGNPAALAAVADAWWDAAQAKPAQKAELATGARQWYQAAVNSLSGLQKTRIDNRITEANLIVAVSKIPPTLLPPPGSDAPAVGAVDFGAAGDDKPFMPVPAPGGPSGATVTIQGNTGVAPASAASPVADTASEALERRVAQWVLSVGGNVGVQTRVGTRSTVRTAAMLPVEPFHLYMVSLRDRRSQNDVALANLAGIARVEILDFANTQITGTGLSHLTSSAGTITSINFDRAEINDEGMAYLARFPHLNRLHLHNTKVTDRSFAVLARLTKMRYLGLTNIKVADDAVVHLAGLTELTDLILRGSGISDAALSQLGNLSELYVLDLADTRVTDAAMPMILRYRKLRTLNLDHAVVTDASLQYFERLSELRSLALNDTHVTVAAVEALRTRIPACKITHSVKRGPPPGGLPATGAIAPANTFASAGPLSPRVIAERLLASSGARGPSVTIVDAGGVESVVKKVEALPPGEFDIVEINIDFKFDSGGFQDADLPAFAGLKKLRKFSLRNSQFTGSNVVLLKELPALTELTINSSPFGDASVDPLAEMSNLTYLSLALTRIGDLGVAKIGNLTQLKSASFERTSVTDAVTRTLQRWTELEELVLADCPAIGDPAVAAIALLPKLKTLGLRNTRVTDQSVNTFVKMKSLTTLFVNQKLLSPAALERLRTERPDLMVKFN
jgi:Leucine-rich repeat (LRR) protein